MRTSKLLLSSSFAFGLAATSGCFVVDDASLDGLMIVDTPDSGSTPVADVCGAASYVVSGSGDQIVETAGLGNDLNTSLCSGNASPGPDAFLKIDASQGQYWHFHVSPAPGNTETVDPIVSLFRVNASNVCNTADCTFVLNRCNTDTEHFGVEFPSNSAGGSWALAIDNAMNTQGRFRVAVFKPICGDNVAEHGESCDTGGVFDAGNPCDSKCRRLLQADGTDSEPNDDHFWANHVDVTSGGGPITISSPSFVNGVCDPDVFVINVPMGKTFQVLTMTQGTGTCRQYADASLHYTLRANTATGTSVASFVSGSGGNAGCGIVTATPSVSADTEVFITVEGAAGTTGPELYALEFSITN